MDAWGWGWLAILFCWVVWWVMVSHKKPIDHDGPPLWLGEQQRKK